jgi:hypothetical protein
MKTEALRRAIDKWKFDAAFGGGGMRRKAGKRKDMRRATKIHYQHVNLSKVARPGLSISAQPSYGLQGCLARANRL